jgi:cell division protein FtsW
MTTAAVLRMPGASARRDVKATPSRGPVRVLVALVAVLCLIGLVMGLSASAIVSLGQYGSPWHLFARQVLYLLVGVVAFLVAMRARPELLRRFGRPVMVLSVGLLMAVLVPGIGVRTAGAARWLGTAGMQIQPSELAKIALVVFAADVLDRRDGKAGWKYQMGPVILVVAILVGLVVLQPDLGTALILALIAMAMMFSAGMPLRPMAGLCLAGAGATFLLSIVEPYRLRRLTSFMHPFRDPTNTGYQSVQALYALSHGGLLGDGLGQSIASWGYLPNAQTDFIFAVIGEETGLVGALVVAGLFVALGLVGVRVACRAPTRYTALLAAGITAWLVGQAVLNIAAVVGLLPVTGVPLPFVSFGGSSLVIAMAGAGLVAGVARRS